MNRLIKRYENRKLYDAHDKRYVSLEDIAFMVRNGDVIQVIDSKSGDDLTTQTLTQVIAKEGKKERPPLPTDLLHDIICLGANTLESGIQHVTRHITRTIRPDRPAPIRPENEEKEDLATLRKKIDALEKMIYGLKDKGSC